MTATTITKTISYDRTSKDFRAELGGELVGYFGSYHEAEVELDRLVAEQLSRQVVYARPAEEPEMVAAEPYTISEPQPCAGLQEDHRYYEVTVSFGLRADRYRLHNEWPYGIDMNIGPVGKPSRWVGRSFEEHEQRSGLPDAANAELRALWERLFAPEAEPYDDTLHIPARDLDGQCACGATLDSLGLCGCLSEQDVDRPRTLTFHPGGTFAISRPAPSIPHDPALLLHWWHADREVCALLLMTLDAEQLRATAAAFADYLNMRVAGSICGAALRAESVLKVWSRMIEAASPPLRPEPPYQLLAA